MAERRRLPRASTQIPIRILHSSQAEMEAHTHNLSGSGVYCETNRLLPLMAKVRLTLLIPPYFKSRAPRKIVCDGAVVRVQPSLFSTGGAARYLVAIFFTDIKPADRDHIVHYVAHHLAAAAPPSSSTSPAA